MQRHSFSTKGMIIHIKTKLLSGQNKVKDMYFWCKRQIWPINADWCY